MSVYRPKASFREIDAIAPAHAFPAFRFQWGPRRLGWIFASGLMVVSLLTSLGGGPITVATSPKSSVASEYHPPLSADRLGK